MSIYTEDDDTETAAAVQSGKPQFHKVVLTHPSLNRRTVFRSISEPRAQQWLMNHYPRGSEAHLVAPDGTATHYEAERVGANGMHAEPWAPFDPDSWVPTDQAPPPGDSVWADKEG